MADEPDPALHDAFYNHGNRKLVVPGLNFWPPYYEFDAYHRFAHGADDFKAARLLAREIAMLGVMNSLTDKPGWHKKVFDEEVGVDFNPA